MPPALLSFLIMRLSTPLSLLTQFCLGATLVSAQIIFQSVPDSMNFTDTIGSNVDPGPAVTTVFTTVSACDSVPAGCTTSSWRVSVRPSPVSPAPFAESALSGTPTPTIILETSSSSDPPNPTGVVATAPNGKNIQQSQMLTQVIISVVTGFSLLPVLAAIVLLLRRRSRRNHRNSKFVVNPEAAPSSVEPPQHTSAAGVTPTSDQPGSEDAGFPTMQQLVHLEDQVRLMRQEIEALKRSNPFDSESAKGGYSVDAAQSEKFDALAARTRVFQTHREPDTQDAPPGYRQFEPAS
ncbi:hypothetical protein C8R44DRAFT_855775 [Mycena epipterygia]|nr:hypothetical protein C8R44DRAFT_855775 [Mycena epipterygia]